MLLPGSDSMIFNTLELQEGKQTSCHRSLTTFQSKPSLHAACWSWHKSVVRSRADEECCDVIRQWVVQMQRATAMWQNLLQALSSLQLTILWLWSLWHSQRTYLSLYGQTTVLSSECFYRFSLAVQTRSDCTFPLGKGDNMIYSMTILKKLDICHKTSKVALYTANKDIYIYSKILKL